MTIEIQTLTLGPLENKTYLIHDTASKEGVIVDPAIPSKQISTWISQNDISLKYILVTHAHFDHIGGVKWVQNLSKEQIPVALHEKDLQLWNEGGGAKNFGFDFDPGAVPNLMVEDQQDFQLGNSEFKVLFTPGHSPGHVTYVFMDDKSAFCGDLIFFHSVGRTDLEHGCQDDLAASIHQKIFTLPIDTVLYPGHGRPTTVGEEKKNNPYL
jgi:glyoxylase-like metal-dependent hydrolase (beta-lactamase superfamily II)